VAGRAFWGRNTETQSTKKHGEQRWLARSVMHIYGGKLWKTLL
jgi:hypothetical protein